MQLINSENITIDNLSFPGNSDENINASVLRLDKIHPVISGNKWFKLRYYLDEAKYLNKKTIVTYGGAWSNHILATAAACKINEFNSIGIIRGEEIENLSSTLLQAKDFGMKIVFMNRNDYQNKIIPLEINTDECYMIAEGGYGKKGAIGASTILKNFTVENYTHICCAAGTGTMAAGLLNGLSADQKLIAISVLKNYLEIENKIKALLETHTKNLTVIHDYHFGGYAKYKPELIQFMNDLYTHSNTPTDFVYTGKLFYAISDLIKKNYFPKESKLLIIHSGGLQGNRSLNKGKLIF